MSEIILGTVHGDKIDGHFFERICDYYQQQIFQESARLSSALKEATDHIEDPDLIAKYREIAEQRAFQHGTVNVRSGPLLSMGRGVQCQAFLDQTDAPWLWISDTDMSWHPHLPQQMVELAEQGALLDGVTEPIKVLSAIGWILTTNQAGEVVSKEPNVYKGVDTENGHWLVKMTAEELAEPALYKVGACGAALMLIHRSVLVELRDRMDGRPHWWHHLQTPDGLDQYGEDTSFSIRCYEAGIPVWVHSGIKLGHAKTTVQY